MINQIIHGDCLEVMKEIPAGSVDMILCDLPYGTTACAWDSIIPFGPLWEQYKRIIKGPGVIVLTASQPFTSSLIMSNSEMFRYRWIWDKQVGANFQLAKLQPLNIVEDICVFSHGKSANGAKVQARYYPIKTHRDKPIKYGGAPSTTTLNKNTMKRLDTLYEDRYPTSILSFPKDFGSERLHPTQKPVALFQYLIKTYTSEGDTVLDNCIGSGTTAVAALSCGRNFIGIEKEREYVDIARKRLQYVQPVMGF